MSEPTTMWDADLLHIWAEFDEEGNLVISGQDLKPSPFGDEYEYAITVQREHTEKVVLALGGVPGEEVMRLLQAQELEIHGKGVQRWLESIDVSCTVWVRIED